MAMQIKSSERGVIRVFHVDLPKEAIERFTTQAGTGEWPLQYSLGAKALRSSFVEIIDLRDLGGMTLSDYLRQAHDVSDDELGQMRAQLNGLKGYVVVLPSQAFDQTEQDLSISTPLRWIGTFNEPKAKGHGAPVQSASAKGNVGQTPATPAPVGGSAFWYVVGAFVVIAGGVIAARFIL